MLLKNSYGLYTLFKIIHYFIYTYIYIYIHYFIAVLIYNVKLLKHSVHFIYISSLNEKRVALWITFSYCIYINVYSYSIHKF
jgi:hypothetical protein